MSSLNLHGCCELTDEGMRALALFTALTSLDLLGGLSEGGGDGVVTPQGLATLAPLVSLSRLHMEGRQVTDETLRAMMAPPARRTALRCLELFECGRLTDEGFRCLAPLTSLTSLDVG
eukprot:2222544-Pyramimonas_sp.AAC.1